MKITVTLLAVIVVGGGLGYLLRPKVAPATAGRTERHLAKETDWRDYQWPTDASTVRTSDFAEFRSNHFHAGIDVSTNMRTGYKVFAARKGWLHSIAFEPYGYGWILTLRHPDGYYTCYAHLKGFPERILQAFQSRLAEMERSFGPAQWDANAVPVTKGEVIAYTGDTGAGPPHLHFEIRDTDFHPVNPGLAPQLRPVDSIPPDMRQVRFYPLDAASSVDGSSEPKTVNLVRTGARSFSIAGVPVLRGRVGVMLRAHDRAQGAEDNPTPYRIQFRVDDALRFETRFDWFRDECGWHIRIDRDHWSMLGLKGEFRKLFREEGNILPVYSPDTSGAGILSAQSAGYGPKRISITASDLAGNASSATFTVRIGSDLRCLAYVGPGDEIVLDRIPAARLSRVDLASTGRRGSSTVVKSWRGADIKERITWNGPHNALFSGMIALHDRQGNIASPIFVNGKHRYAPGTLAVSREIRFDQIILTLDATTAFSAPPVVTCRVADADIPAVMISRSLSRYTAILTPRKGNTGVFSINVQASVGGATQTWQDRFSAALITSEAGGEVRSDDGAARMRFGPNEVYRSMLCGLEAVRLPTGIAYQAFPVDVPLAGAARVAIRSGNGASRTSYIRAFSNGTRYRFSMMDGDDHDRWTAGRFSRLLGRYQLVDDRVPPVVTARIAGGTLQLAIADSLSGIAPATILVKAGEAVLPLEFSEKTRIYFVPKNVFRTVKSASVTVRVSDNVGNTTARNVSIR